MVTAMHRGRQGTVQYKGGQDTVVCLGRRQPGSGGCASAHVASTCRPPNHRPLSAFCAALASALRQGGSRSREGFQRGRLALDAPILYVLRILCVLHVLYVLQYRIGRGICCSCTVLAFTGCLHPQKRVCALSHGPEFMEKRTVMTVLLRARRMLRKY